MKINFDKYDASMTNNLWSFTVRNKDNTGQYIVCVKCKSTDDNTVEDIYIDDTNHIETARRECVLNGLDRAKEILNKP